MERLTLIVYIIQSFIIDTDMPKSVTQDSLSAPIFNYVVTPAIAIAVLFCLV